MGFEFGANELMEERELPLQDVTTRARRLLLPVGFVMTYEECSCQIYLFQLCAMGEQNIYTKVIFI